MKDKTFRRKNHYVPEFLLKRFTSTAEEVNLWEYRLLVEDKRVPEWQWQTVSRLARTSDLYTIAEANDESDRVERWLDEEFESPAQEAVLAAIAGERLSKVQWSRLIRLYASQFLRTPAYFLRNKDEWARKMQAELHETQKRLLNQLPKCEDPESDLAIIDGKEGFPLRYIIRREEGLRRSLQIQHVTGRKYWMWIIQGGLRQGGKAEDLEQYRWSILTAPAGVNWFLTDNPAVCMRRRPDGMQSFNSGWGMANSKLMLPLSPKRLFYCQVGAEDKEQYSTVHPIVANHIRSDLADAALRSFYSPVKDKALVSYRPRRIDRDRFQDEAKQWADFGKEHSRAERYEPPESKDESIEPSSSSFT